MAEDPRPLTDRRRARRVGRTPNVEETRRLTAAAKALFAGDEAEVGASGLEGDPEALFPEERTYIERAADSRRREFATGRTLARELMTAQGMPPAPLLRDADRVPVWPRDYCGSISHTRDFCIAAIAPLSVCRGVGVDIELDVPLKEELLTAICTPAERSRLSAGDAGLEEATLHFSIKEAVYKACYPVLRERWDFQDVELEIDLPAECFRAVPPASAGRTIKGRFSRCAGFVLSGAFWRSA